MSLEDWEAKVLSTPGAAERVGRLIQAMLGVPGLAEKGPPFTHFFRAGTSEEHDMRREYVAVVSEAVQDILDERYRQDQKWGEQNHPDGIDPRMTLSTGIPVADLATRQRELVDQQAKDGRTNWADILLEELYEAFAEECEICRRDELVQVAAVLVNWIEAMDRKRRSE